MISVKKYFYGFGKSQDLVGVRNKLDQRCLIMKVIVYFFFDGIFYQGKYCLVKVLVLKFFKCYEEKIGSFVEK